MANFTKILGLAGIAMAISSSAFAAVVPATCAAPTSTTGLIRAEGTTEQVSSVTVVCTITGAGNTNPGGVGINAQVFISPSLPVTSRVLTSGASPTEATMTMTATAGGVAGAPVAIQGTVSGSTINFSGTTPAAAMITNDTLTFTLTNIRVNASSLTVSTGVPPSVSETIFVSGAAVVPAALGPTSVAFAQNGLGATKTFKAFTGTLPTVGPAANGTGTGATSGVNNFVICNTYSPKADGYTPPAAAGKSLAAVVEVNENFAQAFKSAAEEADQTVVAGPGTPTSTRFKLNFANVPSNVTLVLPVGGIQSQATAGTAVATWVTSDTGNTAATTDGLTGENGLQLKAVTVSAGAGSATFSITTSDPTNLDKFDIPVFVITSSNTVPGSATPMTVSVSLAPVGSTSVPNFVVGSSTTTTTLSTFNLCTTSLLFPFVTNQLGFDTGIAISNTSTDPFGSNGATAQAGTCTLNFYGAGAPSPSNVTTPNVPSGTVYPVVLSSVAAGFQGYIIAQCAFQFAHGFAFITDGVGVNGGLSQGYLAGVIPDVNQSARAANPSGVAPGGSGETLGN